MTHSDTSLKVPSITLTEPAPEKVVSKADFNPVVDPSTGRFNRANIALAIEAIQDAIPPLHSIKKNHPKAANAFAKIITELDALDAKVKKLPAGGPAASRDLGFALRDAFAKMQSLAYKAAGALVPTTATGLLSETDVSKIPDKLRTWIGFGNALGGMFGQLKENSLTAAASFAADAYAIKEHANLDHAVGIDQPGAITINRQGVTAGGTSGVLAITGSASKGQLQLRDDDGAFLLIGNHDINLTVGADLVVAALTGQGGTGFGRRVLADGDTKVAIKARSNFDAHGMLELMTGNPAGPKARALREVVETAKNAAGTLLGRNYVQAVGVPSFLGDDKVAKGYTTAKLELWAEHADSLAKKISGDKGKGPGPLSQMVASAYPSIPEIAEQAAEGNAEMPDISQLDKTSPAPAAMGRTVMHYRQPYVAGVAAFGLKGASALDGNAQMSMGVSAMAKGDKLDVRVKATKVAHEMLDMSTFKDPKQTFNLVRQYDAQLG